jgi:hypothetical protein
MFYVFDSLLRVAGPPAGAGGRSPAGADVQKVGIVRDQQARRATAKTAKLDRSCLLEMIVLTAAAEMMVLKKDTVMMTLRVILLHLAKAVLRPHATAVRLPEELSPWVTCSRPKQKQQEAQQRCRQWGRMAVRHKEVQKLRRARQRGKRQRSRES